MYILGLNAYHGDSSACIYKDTALIAASEEERFRRIKHWAGLPVEAIRFCLGEAGITLEEVDAICVSRNPSAKLLKKGIYVLKSGVSLSNLKNRISNSYNIKSLKKDIAEAFGMAEVSLKATIHNMEHHRCHIASAFYVSPFEEAAILSVDGMGDFTSTMFARAKGNKIEVMDSISYPHSLGMFYTAFTQLLGFPHYGDEYKVMGLAPYGTPVHIDKLRKVIPLKSNGKFELNDKFFRHFKEGVSMSWNGGSPHVEPLFSEEMVRQFGPVRKQDEPLSQYHKDMATSVQRLTEEIIFYMAKHLHEQTGLKNLCVTGGVAQNSVANGKILKNTPFENLFVPPAGHDAGTCIGAALLLTHGKLGNQRSPFRPQAYTGIRFTNDEIEAYLKKEGLSYERLPDTELMERVSDCLINAGVVGWFQGRAEFGPRALGNRSILADPSRTDAKDLLNAKIKRRESFRPFAPSILKEATGDYFEEIDSVPFMEKVFVIKPEMRDKIPAVTHVDGTGRLQTVEERDNPRYYQLIKAFGKKSGVPILLNTSFNENEPIVNSIGEAVDCFLRTKMDMLVLENIIVSRNTA